MLEMLQVRNLAVIREAQVEFGEGLNILTGETGAGKSVILGGVNLCMGEKASKDLIREGAAEASCQMVFLVEDAQKRRELQEASFPTEEDRLILSRRVQTGRSICRIGGELVTAAALKEVSAGLIDIHGQHESRFLLNKRYHLQLLDEYDAASGAEVLSAYRTSYQEYRALEKTLSENDRSDEERLREMSFLEFEIDEITSAGLTEGEDEELEARFRRMSHAQQVIEALSMAQALSGAEGAGDALQRACREISSVMRYGRDLEELYGQMAEVSDLLDDLNRSLREQTEAYAFSAEEYDEVQQRLNRINRLKQKYGRSIADILASLEEKQAQLEHLRALETWKAEMTQRCSAAKAEAVRLAGELTRIRMRKAASLEQDIIRTLSALNFVDPQFRIQIEEVPLGETGADRISFLISTNPGDPLKPLEKIASGGELSRIMLALRTADAKHDRSQTLIFDEIDSGISGRTAQKVGELLKRLSRTHQIICITHLPQIAAMADRHFVIEKTVDGTQTISSIRQLDETQSVEELARMLGGARITEAVLENAREMKTQAAALS